MEDAQNLVARTGVVGAAASTKQLDWWEEKGGRKEAVGRGSSGRAAAEKLVPQLLPGSPPPSPPATSVDESCGVRAGKVTAVVEAPLLLLVVLVLRVLVLGVLVLGVLKLALVALVALLLLPGAPPLVLLEVLSLMARVEVLVLLEVLAAAPALRSATRLPLRLGGALAHRGSPLQAVAGADRQVQERAEGALRGLVRNGVGGKGGKGSVHHRKSIPPHQRLPLTHRKSTPPSTTCH